MNNQFDFTEDEKIIAEAVLESRKIQEFLWRERSNQNWEFDIAMWIPTFQKRVDKISAIKSTNPSAKVELRKRILQQAALSIAALKSLDNL
jgi:hypothetical protein